MLIESDLVINLCRNPSSLGQEDQHGSSTTPMLTYSLQTQFPSHRRIGLGNNTTETVGMKE
jgi:hypothetical protein